MTPELAALSAALVLQGVQYVLMSVPANLELGAGKTMSPRDRDRLGGDLQDQVSVRTARLYRALNNHFEGLVLFTGAVVVTVLSGGANGLTATLAWVYVAARVLYVPAYAFGWTPWRSVIWAVGFLATFAMLGAALI